jgi:hypothetical protein
MHKPVLASLSTNGMTPGHLATIGEALGNATPPINIGAVGGAEWEGNGAVALLLDHPRNEDNSEAAASIIRAAGYDAVVIEGVTAELDNRPGELGRAARKLADANINIASVLVVGVRGPRALVNFGVDPADLDAARRALGVDYSILAD